MDHTLNSKDLESYFMATFSTLKFGARHLGNILKGKYSYCVNNDLNWARKIGLLPVYWFITAQNFTGAKFYFLYKEFVPVGTVRLSLTLFISVYIICLSQIVFDL